MPKPYIPNDKWSQKAAQEGFRARSVYKLIELDLRLHLLRPGMTVLDLGAAPGSWLQYTSKRIGPTGRAIGVDLTAIESIAPNVTLAQLDVTNDEALTSLLASQHIDAIDLMLSDIAPSTSGVKDVDQWRSVELAQSVIAVASRLLKPQGFCVVKVFRGADFDEFLRGIKAQGIWNDPRVMQVQASRDRSREVYVAMKRK